MDLPAGALQDQLLAEGIDVHQIIADKHHLAAEVADVVPDGGTDRRVLLADNQVTVNRNNSTAREDEIGIGCFIPQIPHCPACKIYFHVINVLDLDPLVVSGGFVTAPVDLVDDRNGQQFDFFAYLLSCVGAVGRIVVFHGDAVAGLCFEGIVALCE